MVLPNPNPSSGYASNAAFPFPPQTPMHMNRSLVLISALGLTLGLSSAAAQAPAQSPPAAQAPGGAAGRGAPSPAGVPAAPGGRAGGGGGGRGAAGPSFTTTQLIALGTIDTPALIKAAADAATDLRNASLTKPKDVPTKAKALGDAELALALSRASAVSNLQASPDRLNAEQLASVKSNNGLNRGGNTSPGATIAYSDYTGFVALWDGKTFKNWDGETDVWSIDHDAIHADTTKTPGQHHLHYTGPGAVMKDFDFKVEVKMGGNANGGIQYRSRLLAGHGPKNSVRAIFDPKTIADPMGMPLPAGITTAAAAAAAGITGGNPWQMSGYQFDMNTANNYTGQLY